MSLAVNGILLRAAASSVSISAFQRNSPCRTFACFFLVDDFVKLFDESDIRYQQMQYWDDLAGTSRKFWISMKFCDTESLNNESMTDAVWPNGDQNPYDGVYEPQQ